MRRLLRPLGFAFALTAAGCTCGDQPSSVPPPNPVAEATPEPTPIDVGWRLLAVTPDHGVPRAVAYERGGAGLWWLSAEGDRLRRIVPGTKPGAGVPLEKGIRLDAIVAERLDGYTRVTGLDVAARSLRIFDLTDDGVKAIRTEPVVGSRPPGFLDLESSGAVVSDPARRPLGDVHPAFRGFPVEGDRRVRAGNAGAGPMLFVTAVDGAIRRVLLGSIPKAEKLRALGVDASGLPWLVAESGPEDDRTRHLIRVDLDGRVLERAVAPKVDDSKGTAGTGKGAGKAASAVAADGKVAWVTPGPRGTEVHEYRPGVPGRGLLRVAPKTPKR